jgi:simple sugar transport system permease protein
MMVILAMLAAIVLGMLYSCLLGIAAIHFKADQTLIGTAMNLLATAAATVFVKAMNTAMNPDNHSSEIEYLAGRKMFIVNINGFEFNWFMPLAVIVVILVYLFLSKYIVGGTTLGGVKG